jgi:hypothetical protein
MNEETPKNGLFISKTDSYEEGESISALAELHDLISSEDSEFRKERNTAHLADAIRQEGT